ncbi:TRM11 family SAM-dependent methyltransferase [Rhizomonospora bruguierae]|uniref:TRM11 family SAM-dependent methyltransferase n=1 Tax=Rhizomonospora bruguierae TaxID=1581705 RepID=UPI001BCDB476|nr:SAM-dependent methyltransferase [Micromonospora sp. NBRC 107566]
MTSYALLLAPSANRVYAEAAPRLARAELAAFGRVVDVKDTGGQTLGGVEYLTFDTLDGDLTERDIAHLSNLSAAYALFARVGDLLRPVPLHPLQHFDDDLITIPKYAGKTNEQFTRLLLNITLLASANAPAMLAKRLTVLDPLCGRGTTLNQALMYGYDAIGIELDGKDVDAYSAFLRTYLRRKRLKHTAGTTPVRREKRLVARRFEATLGGGQRVLTFAGDTAQARLFLRPGCADVLVTDLPYGVAHGSRAGGAQSRRPLEVLARAVPVWAELLRPGGALGMSWNTHVAGRELVAEVLTGAGLTVVTGPGYEDMSHWVDQAIERDVLVATQPAV